MLANELPAGSNFFNTRIGKTRGLQRAGEGSRVLIKIKAIQAQDGACRACRTGLKLKRCMQIDKVPQ